LRGTRGRNVTRNVTNGLWKRMLAGPAGSTTEPHGGSSEG
jgi:hypothetical protein